MDTDHLIRMTASDPSGDGFRKSAAALASFIMIYIASMAALSYLMRDYLPRIGVYQAPHYTIYANVLVTLALGYLLAVAVSNTVYWNIRRRYDHPTAAALRSLIRFVGVGVLVSAIAGGVAGGAAGVALAGFLALAVGFASQQVLGQALAGVFLLLSKPFQIGDPVNIAGEDGVVAERSILFTTVEKADGVKTLIPNGMIVGSKVHLKPKSQ